MPVKDDQNSLSRAIPADRNGHKEMRQPFVLNICTSPCHRYSRYHGISDRCRSDPDSPVKANAFSEGAKAKIEALGGTCEVI